MLFGDAGDHSARACPVTQVWYEHTPGFIEIALQLLQLATVIRPRPGVQFLKHDRTQPQGRLCGPTVRKECRLSPRTQSADVNGRIEQDRHGYSRLPKASSMTMPLLRKR